MVLIVAKCNVNVRAITDEFNKLAVLIVAKCNVNLKDILKIEEI